MLRMMRELLHLDMWLVTRVHEEEWIVLSSFGEGPIGPGTVLPLKATICNEMLAGHGPNIVPNVADVPAYENVPIMGMHPVQSYAGAPLVVNGAVYGVLCGMSETPNNEITPEQTPHLITAARTLSTILGQQLHSEALARRAERAENDALMDELTGLYNRRGWEQLVALEQARGRRYGHKHAVFFMDIDGLKAVNDEQGMRPATTSSRRWRTPFAMSFASTMSLRASAVMNLRSSQRETAGGEATILRERLAQGFRDAGVSVSIGFARADILDLAAATREADQQMYQRKAERAS